MRMPFAARPVPPLVLLAGAIAGDFVSTLVFAVLFSATHSLGWSLGAALASGVAGVAWTKARGRKVDAMQGLSLALVVVFGGASLLTRDARIVMFKPTVIYLAVAAVMLKPGWMRRYLPAKAQRHGAGVTDAFGYAWSAGMAALALANLALALHGDVRLWAGFLATAPMTLKLGLGATQYAVTRHTVVSAIRREQADAEAAAANPRGAVVDGLTPDQEQRDQLQREDHVGQEAQGGSCGAGAHASLVAGRAARRQRVRA